MNSIRITYKLLSDLSKVVKAANLLPEGIDKSTTLAQVAQILDGLAEEEEFLKEMEGMATTIN